MEEKGKEPRAAGLPAEAPEAASPPADLRASDANVSPAQLEKIIRRASDLQFRDSSELASNLPPQEVVRIGQEVGLDPRFVRQALAEVQAEALIPASPADSGLARRVVGPAIVRASRVVRGDQDKVERALEEHFRDRELLKEVRSRRGRSLWEPAGGVVSSMRRAMDVGGHGYELAKARTIGVAIEQLEPGWSLITLTADIRNLRGQSAGGFFGGLGLAAAAASATLVLVGGVGILTLLGVGLSGAGAVALGTWGATKDVRKKRERMELKLEGLLDRLEHGDSLGVTGEPWHQRLLR